MLSNVFFFSLVDIYSNEKRRATAFGIFSTFGTLGYVTGILLLGTFADFSSSGIFIMFPVTLAMQAFGFVIAILLYFLVFRKNKKIENNQE